MAPCCAMLTCMNSAAFASPVNGTLAAGAMIQALNLPPQCVDGIWWWQVTDGQDVWNGWLPETVESAAVVEPFAFQPAPPMPVDVPLQPPLMTTPDVPLPTVSPAVTPQTLDPAFAAWDWATATRAAFPAGPDPLTMRLPDRYGGDLPLLPVDLSSVYFVQDAALNADQLALLAQNGFVVVPGSYAQFDDAYADWSNLDTGQADFITTDAILHALYLTYQNALMFLEQSTLYGQITHVLMQGYQAAEQQAHEAVGTPLEAAAHKAAVYFAVPLILIADGENYYLQGYDQVPVFGELEPSPSSLIASADPAIIAEAQPLADAARAAEGRLDVPILDQYTEDFSQYKPRSYYAGDPLLESYFRAMMWLGRITFTAKSDADTLTGLLVLRALASQPETYATWQDVASMLDFLVGPIDNYSPTDYLPLAQTAFGDGLALTALSNPDKMITFRVAASQLPPPKINSIPIPAGPTTSDAVTEAQRGFRLFGQRFTFDGYVMQQLIYPAVGTDNQSRALPLSLDVPAVLGSDTAFVLADQAGATGYAHYTDHVAALRDEVNGLSADDWLQNVYGGWLWTLQPLFLTDPALLPPLMQTDAWQRKSLATTLGSYTELKHATLLYAAQPMGGLGGGGMEPPVTVYSYVEPNPQVFQRIAIVAALMDQGLRDHGAFKDDGSGSYGAIYSIDTALQQLAGLSSYLAEIARKEVAGEPVSHDEYYYLQQNFHDTLWYLRYGLEIWITDPPENSAVVADIASNAAAGMALEIGTGTPDLIYVVTDSPYGLQLTRGAVFSPYEFTVPIDNRMTDDDWRAQLAAGTQPPRPDWIDLYFSK